MRRKIWITMIALLLAGFGLAVGAWGYLSVSPRDVIVPGSFEVWGTLRPGNEWQNFWDFRDGLRFYGGSLFLLTVALALFHYAAVGPDRVPESGQTVRRFRWGEVLMHATLLFSSIALWASGLYLLWNRLFLEGPAPTWGHLASAVHIWGGLLFLVALVAMWLQWRRDMRLVASDRDWLRRAGGYLSREHKHLPAGRFNAGQKIWFRATLVLGAVLGLSGLLLYYPGGFGLTLQLQRLLFIVHTAGAIVMVSGMVLHAYIATVAVPGVFNAMVTGRMNENLIWTHHPDMNTVQGGTPAGNEN